MKTSHHFRTLFLSDIHLGYKDCKAEYLLDLLDHCQADQVYLVGDIIDLYALKRKSHWPESHGKVLDKLFKIANSQTQVFYIPGNHDASLRDYTTHEFAQVTLLLDHIHETADGRRFFVFHGDILDPQVCMSRWYAVLGDKLYDLIQFLNRWCNHSRRLFGYRYWSLSGYIKSKVAKAGEAMHRYKVAAVHEAKKRNLDGVICGHIHHPEIDQIDDLIYCNDGDWVENCTALVEDFDGQLSLLHWTEEQATVISLPHTSKSHVA
ncbi:UDP-2,3-diacylglucosamine diphosphatase [Algicola sagamiensis]|uniref:UDP-2,3-diacylglucosamine diphosphatase n=1 Tax=Algicola sagamiensis TaxID=163869 RepID=UPI00037A33E3|nr:UDP-2,3-diacylglucosamine diphosphatase [Algicola sagamiensis]